MIPVLPETAPFSPDQRAWLNGFFAGVLGLDAQTALTSLSGNAANDASAGAALDPAPDDGELPWHDPALVIGERMTLAEGRPVRLKLMAAMGQLDCGQCGYECRSYAAAIASGAEGDLGKCVPGGKATARMLKKLTDENPRNADPALAPPAGQKRLENGASIESAPLGSRDRPLQAKLLRCDLLHARDSDTATAAEKDTRGVVLALGNTGLAYEPGDALGVWPGNNPDEVELLLSILRSRGARTITLDGATLTAREALMGKVNLREPTPRLFALLAEHARLEFEAQRLHQLAENDELAAGYGVHDVFDALVKFRSARPPVAQFVQSLARLQPRLYSIASSSRAHPGEVHLTVGVVRYELNGRGYQGLGSGYFAEHLGAGRPVRVFLQKAHAFRLPQDGNVPIIMVGPGTGIAPFRAFIEERAAVRATGQNWLFFGAQREATDFLYRGELEAYRDSGVLTRMTLAFSRDQPEKIYVQHRMLEHAAELWEWLQRGAHFYVCGDAQRMAADVDRALVEIVASAGAMSGEQARGWVKDLAKAGRYQRDVY